MAGFNEHNYQNNFIFEISQNNQERVMVFDNNKHFIGSLPVEVLTDQPGMNWISRMFGSAKALFHDDGNLEIKAKVLPRTSLRHHEPKTVIAKISKLALENLVNELNFKESRYESALSYVQRRAQQHRKDLGTKELIDEEFEVIGDHLKRNEHLISECEKQFFHTEEQLQDLFDDKELICFYDKVVIPKLHRVRDKKVYLYVSVSDDYKIEFMQNLQTYVQKVNSDILPNGFFYRNSGMKKDLQVSFLSLKGYDRLDLFLYSYMNSREPSLLSNIYTIINFNLTDLAYRFPALVEDGMSVSQHKNTKAYMIDYDVVKSMDEPVNVGEVSTLQELCKAAIKKSDALSEQAKTKLPPLVQEQVFDS